MIHLPDGTPATINTLTQWLRASLHRGTPRPHPTTPTMSDERRAARDHEAHLERLERTDVALGEHPAPYHLDIDELLDTAPTIDTDQTEHDAWTTQAFSALGLINDGQLLDAHCPWCDGRTSSAPAGGARTLRVRVLRDGRAAVVCEGNCQPPEADYGTEHRGHPAWPIQTEGEWLAERIEHADQMRAYAAAQITHQTRVKVDHAIRYCRCGNMLPSATLGRPPKHCSQDCRRAADTERKRAERGAA